MCPFIRTIEKTHSIDYFRWVKYILTKNNIFMKHDKTGAARVNRRECEPSPIDQRLQSSQVVMSGTCDKDRLYCHNTWALNQWLFFVSRVKNHLWKMAKLGDSQTCQLLRVWRVIKGSNLLGHVRHKVSVSIRSRTSQFHGQWRNYILFRQIALNLSGPTLGSALTNF